MPRTGNGSTGFIATSGTFTPPTQWSMGFWYRNAATPAAADRQAIGILSAGDTVNAGFNWSQTDAAYRQAAFHSSDDFSFPAAKLTSTLSANTWYQIGLEYDGVVGNDLDALLNGAVEANVAVGGQNTDAVKFGVLAEPDGTNFFDNGTAAYAFFYNTLLSGVASVRGGANAWADLAYGIAPNRIAPANLFVCWPLWGASSPEPDVSGNGRDGTVSGTAAQFATDAPVYWTPRTSMLRRMRMG